MDTKLIDVFRMWEETSYQLECLQANTECVKQEWKGINIVFFGDNYCFCKKILLFYDDFVGSVGSE